MAKAYESWDEFALEVLAGNGSNPAMVPPIRDIIKLAREGQGCSVAEVLGLIDHLRVGEATMESWCQTLVGFRPKQPKQRKLVSAPPALPSPLEAHGAWAEELFKGLVERYPWGVKYLAHPEYLEWAYRASFAWKAAPDHFRLWVLKHEACPVGLLLDVSNATGRSQYRQRAVRTLIERGLPITVTLGTGIGEHPNERSNTLLAYDLAPAPSRPSR